MKEPEFYMDNEPLDNDENPYFSGAMVESMIKKAQVEAYNKAIDDASEAAELHFPKFINIQRDAKAEILKLKKDVSKIG